MKVTDSSTCNLSIFRKLQICNVLEYAPPAFAMAGTNEVVGVLLVVVLLLVVERRRLGGVGVVVFWLPGFVGQAIFELVQDADGPVLTDSIAHLQWVDPHGQF